MDNMIYIAIFLVILLAIFGEDAYTKINEFIWAEEKPKKINGVRVRLGQFDGLGPNPPEQIIGVITYCTSKQYRIDFDTPFDYDGKKEHYALVSARHMGYPVSRMTKRSILAVVCAFESGLTCIANIAKQ